MVELAALLHDIADWKYSGGDESAGPLVAASWLESLKVEPSTVEHVSEIIHHLSFKGAGVSSKMNTLEGQVVQDADRLDALGAIGIARAFTVGQYFGREIYNPNIPVKLHSSLEEYKNSPGTTINHFYEKLLLLKERMNTNVGRRIAESRHKYMEEFLARFFQEWEGKI